MPYQEFRYISSHLRNGFKYPVVNNIHTKYQEYILPATDTISQHADFFSTASTLG